MHKWDAGRALELIERERVTTFGGVPAMVWQVLESPRLRNARHLERAVDRLRRRAGGARARAPHRGSCSPGRTPSNGYGLTETSSVTTMNSGVDYQRKPDSVGVPVPVVRREGRRRRRRRRSPIGEVGELWIKGPNVVKGYWEQARGDRGRRSRDGWLHSGDVARVDDEGFVYIVDRAKDMVIRGGENVYCVEVEAALFEHPDGRRRRGDRHPAPGARRGGRRGRARSRRARPRPRTSSQAHVAERLAAFKVPVRIWFRDEPLPRNPAGKILKRDLRTELVGEG